MNYVFKEASPKEWQKFQEKIPFSSPFQMMERIETRSRMGFKTYILGVFENDILVGGGLLMGKNNEFWIPHGPILDYKNQKLLSFFLRNLIEFAKKHNFIHLEVLPQYLVSRRTISGEIIEKFEYKSIMKTFEKYGFKHTGWTIETEMKALRWVYIKDLTPYKSLDELRADYSKRLRKHLRHLNGKLELVKLSRNELPIYLDIIKASDDKNDVKTRDISYFQHIFDCYGDKAEYLVAKKIGEDAYAATSLAIFHNNEVTLMIGGVKREYRNLEANLWLKDKIMEIAFDRGLSRVNFFGVKGKFEGNGSLDFKAKFGGEVEEYLGRFDLVLSPVKFFIFRVIRKLKSFF
jgi:lipid II:glycine glycyltransferase (peptidoglycan interpeptide bridge formation enzyme)